MNKKIINITRTAIFLAVLLVGQYIGTLIGVPIVKQLVTGSIVNLLLILSTVYCGLFGGLLIAIASPFLAFALGITPLPSIILVPFIAIGNVLIVLISGMVLRYSVNRIQDRNKRLIVQIGGSIIGSFVKFGAIYIGVIVIALPLILSQKPEASHATITNALTTAFTWTQLFTALIGSAFAITLLPIIKIGSKSSR